MRIVYKENILKPIVFIIAALLFNAIVPTLPHAATLLHGTRVNANTLVRDAYVQVTYSDHSDKQKVVKGWIDEIDDSTFTIRSGGTKNRTVIAYDSVISLITVIAKAKPASIVTPVTPASGIAHHIGMMDPSHRIAIKAGVGFAVGVSLAAGLSDRGDGYSEKVIGLLAGYTLGVAAGVSWVDPYDQFTSSFVGSFIGVRAGIGLFFVDVDLSANAVVFLPIIGAVIGSELWRRPPEASYFSVGLAPDREGNLSAVATLRF